MRWTVRKDGSTRGTFTVRCHVPIEMRDFLLERTSMTRSEIDTFFRSHIYDLADGARTLVADPDEGTPYFYDTDHIDDVEADGHVIYEGPDAIFSGPRQQTPRRDDDG